MNKPFKLAYYLSRFPRLSETFILREMCALREKGIDVEIFSIMSPLPTTTMHPQVQTLLPYVHYSAFLLSLKLIFAQIYFLTNSPRRYINTLRRVVWQTSPEIKSLLMALLLFPKSVYFAWLLKDKQVDHIHAHFVWLNAVSAQVAADLLGLPISLHAHAWDIFRRNPECVRRQIQLATCVITVSEYHRQFLTSLIEHLPLDIRIVHYGLNPNEFIRTIPNPNNPIVQILSVGRLVEKKGFEYLIEACKILDNRGIPYRCCIVGEGPDQRINAMISEGGLHGNVTMVGAKNITEIIVYYQMSDFFVLPCVVARSGDRDGMPNVLLEAMAMQLPVITTPVTGNTELIQDGVNGLLVPERDPVALADAIQRLISDPGLRMELGAAGRQTILTGFDIRSTADQMLGIFKTLQGSTHMSD
jgi:glycosyltransferase involved in cell wall biosynthesis